MNQLLVVHFFNRRGWAKRALKQSPSAIHSLMINNARLEAERLYIVSQTHRRNAVQTHTMFVEKSQAFFYWAGAQIQDRHFWLRQKCRYWISPRPIKKRLFPTGRGVAKPPPKIKKPVVFFPRARAKGSRLVGLPWGCGSSSGGCADE